MLFIDQNDLFDHKKLEYIHRKIILKHGNWEEEYPEQLMSCKFINPDSCVLELGANIGRNTMVIASILTDDKNLVTLECNPIIVNLLNDNKNSNHFSFNIEASALSKHKEPYLEMKFYLDILKLKLLHFKN